MTREPEHIDITKCISKEIFNNTQGSFEEMAQKNSLLLDVYKKIAYIADKRSEK